MFEAIKNLIPPRRSADYAYQMGWDCEINGADTENCHFSIFSSKENAAAWNAGRRAAAEAKEHAPHPFITSPARQPVKSPIHDS